MCVADSFLCSRMCSVHSPFVHTCVWLCLLCSHRVCGPQFFLAYRIQSNGGGAGLLVRNFRSIRNNYLRSWFSIDVMSILPFDAVAQLSGSEGLESLKIIKVVRLLRLLKLARIFKASKIFKRLECRLSVSYSIIGLCKFGALLIVMGHWMACMWCMVAGGMDGQYSTTWINYVACNLNGCDEDNQPVVDLTPWEVFTAAYYWAIVTITSVGYGDITPQVRAPRTTTHTYTPMVSASGPEFICRCEQRRA